MSNIQERIRQLVGEHKVVLFMKGTRMFPQCGFSARAVEIFKRCEVAFEGVNVLTDPELRQGIKDFSSWPTIPQAYIDGEFVGGSDILQEMYESGELQKLLGVDGGPRQADAPPALPRARCRRQRRPNERPTPPRTLALGSCSRPSPARRRATRRHQGRASRAMPTWPARCRSRTASLRRRPRE